MFEKEKRRRRMTATRKAAIAMVFILTPLIVSALLIISRIFRNSVFSSELLLYSPIDLWTSIKWGWPLSIGIGIFGWFKYRYKGIGSNARNRSDTSRGTARFTYGYELFIKYKVVLDSELNKKDHKITIDGLSVSTSWVKKGQALSTFRKLLHEFEREKAGDWASKTKLIKQKAKKLFVSFENILKTETIDGAGSAIKLKKPDAWDLVYFINEEQPHSVIVGTTGSGKTVTVIEPSIDALARGHNAPSLVFADPKGELFEKKSEALKNLGYEVIALNFRDIENTSGWNPLSEVARKFELLMKAKSENKLGDIAKLESAVDQDILEIATGVFSGKKGGSESPIWAAMAQKILIGFIYLLLEEYELGLKDNPTYIYPVTRDQINLAEVATLGLMGMEKVEEYYEVMRDAKTGEYQGTKNPNNKKRKSWVNLSQWVSTATETAAGFKTNFDQKIFPFTTSAIRGITSVQGIDLRTLGEAKTAIFLIIPDEQVSFHFLGTLFVSQAYKTLVAEAILRESSTLPRKVHFLLDEFGNFPAIANFDNVVTVARSRGMRLHPVIQDYAQLEGIYGKPVARTVLANLGNTVYIKTNDVETASILSKRAGKKTIVEETESTSHQEGSKGSTTRGKQKIAVDLIMPDELMGMDMFTGMLFGGKYVTKAAFVPYFYHNTSLPKGSAKLSDLALGEDEWWAKHGWSYDEPTTEEAIVEGEFSVSKQNENTLVIEEVEDTQLDDLINSFESTDKGINEEVAPLEKDINDYKGKKRNWLEDTIEEWTNEQ